MKPEIKHNTLLFGLLLAAISIGYSTIAYVVDESLFVHWFLGIGLLVIGALLLIMSVWQTKKALGGYISFRDAFSAWILPAMLSSALVMVFNMLLYNVIDTDLADRLGVRIMEQTTEMMERFGAADEQVEEAMAKVDETSMSVNFKPLGLLKGFFTELILQSVFAALFAAIFKKEKPVFDSAT